MDDYLRIVCLHGFLGLASDWQFLEEALCRRDVKARVTAPDLWSFRHLSLTDVTAELAVLSRGCDVLVGYSMGGRLALMTFFREPATVKALAILSAHIGGLDEEAGRKRAENDRAWAKKIREESWDALLTAWNAQSVFSADPPGDAFSRSEDQFDRDALASVLVNWSVVNQPDYRPKIAKTKRPVLWMAGAQDPKYRTIAAEVAQLNERVVVKNLSGAGHRLIAHARDQVADVLARFLKREFLS